MPKAKRLNLLLSSPFDDREWAAEWYSRWALLLNHYGIDLNDVTRWYKLAVELAVAHVPGLREREGKPRGRPRDDSFDSRLEREDLLRRVQDVQARNQAISEFAACKHVFEEIRRKEPKNRYAKAKFPTIRRHVSQAKKEATRNALVRALLETENSDNSSRENLARFGLLANLGRQSNNTTAEAGSAVRVGLLRKSQ